MMRQEAYQPQRRDNMQKWDFSKTVLRLTAIIGVLAGMLTILSCGGGEEERGKVATSDTPINVDSTAIRALEGQTFTFPPTAGAVISPQLVNQPITLAFTNTAAATPTATITAPNVRGTDGNPARLTGDTTFGSCTFVVRTSTFPVGQGPQVGQTIGPINPCNVTATGSIQATGQAQTVQILLALGQVPSAPQQAQVAINPDGSVVINTVNTGQTVVLQVVTGAAGG